MAWKYYELKNGAPKGILFIFLFYHSLFDYSTFVHAKITNYFGSTWEHFSSFHRGVKRKVVPGAPKTLSFFFL